MKAYIIIICLLVFYGCTNTNQKAVNLEEKNASDLKKQHLSLFTPKTFYYTNDLQEDNPAWTAAKYSIFQSKTLDSLNHRYFELLDVYGNDDNIVVFNEVFHEGNRIKHIILDTLYNYSDFAKDIPDKGTSVGVLHKDELIGIETKGIEKNSIIAVITTSGQNSFKADVDSAIAKHKKAGKDPFEVVDVSRKMSVIKAWYANSKTGKIEPIKN
ncbi:hypothetical protein H9N25_03570 [Pedobacter riviphilus]|uniref:Uncharacterized protein n=1 Tax=Pedobacter riviphilus TaxID=2766984 RepID=A0ABX6TJ65_9SPHI|nr:hypothetical protein [Pedobacter riviphilus]QNR85567.1 hypothetical protein H9N25_03570 [Pedobacter riviphilus]